MKNNNLRRLREARGLSRRQLAELSGVSEPNFVAIELLDKDFRVDTARQLCKALKVDWCELLGAVADNGR